MRSTIEAFNGPYRFLSNFFIPVHDKSNEHYYQAEKAQWPDERLWVLDAPTPGLAKKRGRKVALRPDWDEIKDEVMLRLLRRKFKNAGLARLLLATQDADLIEGNHWGDTYWGVCGGIGENKLGKLLMQVRRELENA
jgi:ribA/ribD-fused uncharacterized protein